MEAFQVKLTQDDELISTLTIAIEDNYAELHQEVYKFSPSIYKDMLIAFEDLKEKLKEHYNVSNIVIGVESSKYTDKLDKYWKMLGFKSNKKMTVGDNEFVYRTMEVQ